MKKTILRDTAIDWIKAISIGLVILVHTHPQPLLKQTSEDFFSLLIFFLGKLGVPLFVMVSGALLLDKNETLSIFYKKRSNRVLLPWVFWSVLYFLYKIYFLIINISSPSGAIKEFILVFLSDFWFMPMIVGVYILTPYLRKVIQSNISLKPVLITWFVLVSICPLVYLSPLFPGSSSAGLLTIVISFSGYFILGWYCKKYLLTTFSSITTGSTLLLSSLLYVALINIVKNSENLLFFVMNDYFSPSIVVASIATFILIHEVTKHLKNIQITRIITFLSRYSYGIFLSHVLVFKLYSLFFPELLLHLSNSQFLMWLIRVVLVYSSSAALMLLGTKIPFIKKALN